MRLVEGDVKHLLAYSSIPIAFEVRSRVDLAVLRESRGARIAEIPIAPYWKDYDALESLSALPTRFDMSNWLIVAAFDGEDRLGGIIAARDTPGCDMLEGRADLIVPFDVRVRPTAQGRGVGRALFEYVAEWGRLRGCNELRVETQDINVGACRFYRAMGCELHSAQEGAYGPKLDEAMIIWRMRL